MGMMRAEVDVPVVLPESPAQSWGLGVRGTTPRARGWVLGAQPLVPELGVRGTTPSPGAEAAVAGSISSSVSVYLGSPIWCAQALFQSKVDGCVPQTQHVSSRTVLQPE